MENNCKEILAEIRTSIDNLKERLAELEAKLAALESQAQAEPVEAQGPVDISDADIDITDDIPQEFVQEAPSAPEEPVTEEVPVIEEVPVVEEPVVEPVPVVEEAPAVQEAPAAPEEPVAEPAPQPKPRARKPKVSDESHAAVPAWKTDKPGAPVKNIRSAISLYDRALFINTLFKEDYSQYDKTIADLNAMTDMDEAEAYLAERFPDWPASSDVVYRFMMSVRKKLG